MNEISTAFEVYKNQIEQENQHINNQNHEMSNEMKLKLRIQELEDLLVEVKEKGSANKVSELESQVEILNLELAKNNKKYNELMNSITQKEKNVNSLSTSEAIEYYSEIIKSKDAEIEELKRKIHKEP